MPDELSSQLNPPVPSAPAQPEQPAPLPPLGTAPAADIFAGVDSPAAPAAPQQPPAAPAPRPLEPLDHLPELEAEDGRRKVFVWIGVLVAAAVVGVGGWFAYQQVISPAVGPAAPTGEQPQDQPAEQPQGQAPTGEDNDFDRDGLTNAEEEQMQTDPYSADTDADGLYDREEAMAWHTDPLNPDTDGDSYLDGAEVANGYNPKGDGPLMELPTSTAP